MVGLHSVLLASLPSALALVLPGDVGKLPALGCMSLLLQYSLIAISDEGVFIGNSWNALACNINEEKFLTAANSIISLGLKDAGYEYVNST